MPAMAKCQFQQQEVEIQWLEINQLTQLGQLQEMENSNTQGMWFSQDTTDHIFVLCFFVDLPCQKFYLCVLGRVYMCAKNICKTAKLLLPKRSNKDIISSPVEINCMC